MTGPTELVVLTYPSLRPDPRMLQAVAELARSGAVAVLDMVLLARQADGEVRVVEGSEDRDLLLAAGLEVRGQALVSDDDLDAVRESLPVAGSAVVLVLEYLWPRRLESAVRAVGGELALHARIPPSALEAAWDAAG